MKVIQIIPSFALAGAERMCQALSNELYDAGHDIMVISLFSKKTSITEQLEEKGIKLLFLDQKGGSDFSVVRKLRKIFKREKPDIIHTHLSAFQYAAVASLGYKTNIVYTVHNIAWMDTSNKQRKIKNFFIKRNKALLVALSDRIAETVKEYYNIPIDKIPVARNGIDLTACMPKKDYSYGDKIRIINIGRLNSQKNHLCLLDAFAIFIKKFPNAELTLVGDGEERETIEKYALELGISDKVVLTGVQNKVHGYLHDADMFVLSSKFEGFPMVIVEAMGTGLPIVSTNVGGISDALVNEKNALLTGVDSGELADAMIRFAESEELRERLGKAALCDSDKFSSRRMMEDYVDIYSKFVSKRNY